jgi:hypothetical protein
MPRVNLHYIPGWEYWPYDEKESKHENPVNFESPLFVIAPILFSKRAI